MSDILAPVTGELTGAEMFAKPLPGDPSKPFNPPLSRASVEGNFDEVKRLLAQKADVNEIDQGWSTPMHRACWTNNLEIAKYLIDAKADLTLVNIVRPATTACPPLDLSRRGRARSHSARVCLSPIQGRPYVTVLTRPCNAHFAGAQDTGGLRQGAGEAR
jgi:hypothetical protein